MKCGSTTCRNYDGTCDGGRILEKQYKLVTKLDVGMEKEQKQKLGWRVSVLPIPAFHCISL